MVTTINNEAPEFSVAPEVPDDVFEFENYVDEEEEDEGAAGGGGAAASDVGGASKEKSNNGKGKGAE